MKILIKCNVGNKMHIKQFTVHLAGKNLKLKFNIDGYKGMCMSMCNYRTDLFPHLDSERWFTAH